MSRLKTKRVGGRLFFLPLFFVFFTLLIVVKLFILQIVQHEKYLVLANKQHQAGIEIQAKRGTIYSADGFPLATDVRAYLVYAVPKEIEDPEKTAEALVSVLGFDDFTKDLKDAKDEQDDPLTDEEKVNKAKEAAKAYYLQKLDKTLSWSALARKVDASQKQQLEDLAFTGIYFEQDMKRYYPEGSLAAHVLGFVGSDELGKDQGYYGIEGYFDGDLRGIPGYIELEKDPGGNPIPVGEYTPTPSEDGRDVVLTIRRDLQHVVEQKLKAGVEHYGAKNGSVILQDPKTGKILAMANYPTYEPDKWNDEETVENATFVDHAVASAYEPGSVFKAITMAAALETGRFSPTDTIVDDGPIMINGHYIRTWNDQYFGQETMSEILQHSSNTGITQVAQALGLETLYSYYDLFQIDQKTGVALEDEEAGILREKSEYRDIDLATNAFGQGLAVTPLKLAQVYSTIANDGVMMKPMIVERVVGADRTITYTPEEVGRIFSKKTADALSVMLQEVVEKGEFRYYAQQGYAIAGKTGTAQIPVNGQYNPNKTNTTFCSFVPADDPKFTLVVKLTEPSSSTYSAETAVPLAMEIEKALFPFFEISPQGNL